MVLVCEITTLFSVLNNNGSEHMVLHGQSTFLVCEITLAMAQSTWS